MSTTTEKQHTDVTPPAQPEAGVVRLEFGDHGIAILRLGAPSERVVTLTEARLASLEVAVEKLAARRGLRGVIVTGPGPGMFAAGADIGMIDSLRTADEGAAGAARGRELFGRLGALEVPVVAAIDGPCLGGALELALALDYRIATRGKQTSIGLPEVKLGIVPGFGGTQLLTRLVGLPTALDLILKGSSLDGERARRKGIVDRVVPAEKLLEAAREVVEKHAREGRKGPRRRLTGSAKWLSRPPFRGLVASKVRKTLRSGPARFYDAPKRALELCIDALRLPTERGFEHEARALGELVVSPTAKGLLRLYFLTERSKRLGKSDDARDVRRALVLGGGIMGAGIAGRLATKGVLTRLCDLAPTSLAAAKARLQKTLSKQVRRRRLKKHEATAIQDRLAVSTEWGVLRDCDLLLEAVPESLELKQRIFADAIERGLPEHAVVATNTSSLSIDAMAESVPAPERVVGIHFFNPPEKMPLVEVIRGPRTSDAVVATACRLAVRLGKFPVVVKDRAGFLVNRCLAPYINEAARLLLEGNSPESVDRVMLDFGLPMGPCRLLDEVGFDVAAKVSEVLSEAFPDHMSPSPLFAAMVEAGCLGRKTDGGLYDKTGERPGPGRAVLEALRAGAGQPREATRTEVHQRLVYPMVAEAYRILDEGLVEAEEDLDLGLVFGIGFPPFTGGPTEYARREGIGAIVDALRRLASEHGERFEPPRALIDRQ